jgi:hypothetical protein
VQTRPIFFIFSLGLLTEHSRAKSLQLETIRSEYRLIRPKRMSFRGSFNDISYFTLFFLSNCAPPCKKICFSFFKFQILIVRVYGNNLHVNSCVGKFSKLFSFERIFRFCRRRFKIKKSFN